MTEDCQQQSSQQQQQKMEQVVEEEGFVARIVRKGKAKGRGRHRKDINRTTTSITTTTATTTAVIRSHSVGSNNRTNMITCIHRGEGGRQCEWSRESCNMLLLNRKSLLLEKY